MRIATLVSEVARGKSIYRALCNFECRGIKLEGAGVDLGSKTGRASHYQFLDTTQATIVFTDLEPLADTVVQLDLTKPFPMTDGSQDFALLFNVLEHLSTSQTCLSETARILRPGGVLVGCVPFLHRIHPDPDDFFRFTSSGLTVMLRDAGFDDTRIQHIGTGPALTCAQQLEHFIKIRWAAVPLAVTAYGMDGALNLVTRKDWGAIYPLGYVFVATKSA